jgi:hypothetical protein
MVSANFRGASRFYHSRNSSDGKVSAYRLKDKELLITGQKRVGHIQSFSTGCKTFWPLRFTGYSLEDMLIVYSHW